MRLFAAIDLDEEARDAIARLQRSLSEQVSGNRSLKWVNPSHMHLTLAFLGEIADGRVPAIAGALSAAIDVSRFSVAFRGLGVFPPRGAPRVLWLGISEGSDAVVEVQRHVAGRLECLDVALERRSFHPHLTLARWRESRPSDRRPTMASSVSETIARLDVNFITLYQSRLSSAGPTYTAVARANLT